MNLEDTMAFSIDKERKEYHERKRRRKITKLIISGVVWALIFIYLLTPFATYKMMHVKGNVYLSENEILELGKIKNTWWWMVDSKKLKNKLEEYPNIDNVSISHGIDGLNISILEKYPLAVKNNKYLMNTTPELLEKERYPYNIEKLVDISQIDDSYLNLFSNKYIHVDLSIRELFAKAFMLDDKTIVFEGKFNENSYFEVKTNLEYLPIKFSSQNFNKIKNEILGKVEEGNVEYSKDNPCIIEYNLINMYEYKIY